MPETETTWLTLQAAAQRVSCSTKTLYRRMASGRLPYRVGANNRRYVAEDRLLEAVTPRQPPVNPKTCHGIAALHQEVLALRAAVRHQTQLLECAISLYQPKTMADLANKQSASRSIDLHQRLDPYK
jgi:hypothetical protein